MVLPDCGRGIAPAQGIRDPVAVRILGWLTILLNAVGCGDRAEPPVPEPTTLAAAQEDAFWAVVEEVHAATGYDWEAKEALLTKRLQAMPLGELEAWWRTWDTVHARAYDWGLWAAAYVIHGGCSDDGFSDFRGTIIMLGRKTFEDALRNPDSLLTTARAAGKDLCFESFNYVPMSVWDERTDRPYPESPGSPEEPTGFNWEDEDLPRMVPKLWAEYGWGDKGD